MFSNSDPIYGFSANVPRILGVLCIFAGQSCFWYIIKSMSLSFDTSTWFCLRKVPTYLPKRSEVVFPSLFTPKTGLLGMGLTSGSKSPRKTWSSRWIKPQAEAPEAPPAFTLVSSHADHAFLGSHCIQKPAIIISMIALIIPKTLA